MWSGFVSEVLGGVADDTAHHRGPSHCPFLSGHLFCPHLLLPSSPRGCCTPSLLSPNCSGQASPVTPQEKKITLLLIRSEVGMREADKPRSWNPRMDGEPERGEGKWRFPGQGRARLLLGRGGQVQALLEPVLTCGMGHRLQMETKCNRNEKVILKTKMEEDSTKKKFSYRNLNTAILWRSLAI